MIDLLIAILFQKGTCTHEHIKHNLILQAQFEFAFLSCHLELPRLDYLNDLNCRPIMRCTYITFRFAHLNSLEFKTYAAA